MHPELAAEARSLLVKPAESGVAVPARKDELELIVGTPFRSSRLAHTSVSARPSPVHASRRASDSRGVILLSRRSESRSALIVLERDQRRDRRGAP